MNDLRLAARLLLKSPAFSAITVLLLSLGIGANAIFFSAFDHILLRPLRVRNPQELVRFVRDIPGIGVRGGYFAVPYYEALKKNSTTLSAVFGSLEMNAVIAEPAQQVRIHLVTPEYFEALGVPALMGRTLTATDATDSEGAPPAVLSYGFWMSTLSWLDPSPLANHQSERPPFRSRRRHAEAVQWSVHRNLAGHPRIPTRFSASGRRRTNLQEQWA